MFDPQNAEAILKLEDTDLALLPRAEDDRHEYKSSSTKDDELAQKIGRAASGFWNSGGGLFAAGVDKSGDPDGGVSLTVGRQSRRDWIDQAISRVSPPGRYYVQNIENNGARYKINAGNAVALIGFATSENGPHMAPDNRYYVRAGAHTVPASHFIVEAIRARRGLRTPLLRHVVRRKPDGGGVLQVGILNDAPALDVEVVAEPIPRWLEDFGVRLPLIVPVISRDTPFFLDFHVYTPGPEGRPDEFQIKLKYTDLAERTHEIAFAVDVPRQMGPNLGHASGFRDLERAVEKVADAIKDQDFEGAAGKVADAIRSRR